MRLCGADRPDLAGVFLHFDSPAAATLEERLLLSAWLEEVVRGLFSEATHSHVACSGLLCLRLRTVPSSQELDGLAAALRHPSAAAYYRSRTTGLESIERSLARSEQHVLSWAIAEALGDTSSVARLDRAKLFTQSQLKERWLALLGAGHVTLAGTGAATAVQELQRSCKNTDASSEPAKHPEEERAPTEQRQKPSAPSQVVVVDSDAPPMLTFALLPSSASNSEAIALGARILAERTTRRTKRAPAHRAPAHRAPRLRGSMGGGVWALPVAPEDAYPLIQNLREEHQRLASASGAPTRAEMDAQSPLRDNSCLDQRCSSSSPLTADEVQSILVHSRLGVALSGHHDALSLGLRDAGFGGRILTVDSDSVKLVAPPPQKQ